MAKKLALLIIILALTATNAYAAVKYSAGGNYISTTNLSLNPNLTGNASGAADSLFTMNAGVNADFPFSPNGGWIVNAKYDGLMAGTNSIVNNNAFSVAGGAQFYNQDGHYLSILARYKFTNYSNLNYSSNGIGTSIVGLYNINPLKLVGMLDFDSQNGPASRPTSTYTLVTGNLLIGGSPWEGGNIYAGPSITSVSSSPDSIVSALFSASQRFDNLSVSLSYVYQTKAAANGNMFIFGANYSF